MMRNMVLGVGLCVALAVVAQAEDAQVSPDTPESVLDFSMDSIDGEAVDLNSFRGKVLLLVNVASKCGLTGQYKQLTALHEKYREQGFEILGFPANNFMGQEPGTNEEIKLFCQERYDVNFPMFAKISVKGDDQDPLYAFLTGKDTNPEHSGEISWNFEKFLVDRSGEIVARFSPRTKPDAKEVIEAIEKALQEEI